MTILQRTLDEAYLNRSLLGLFLNYLFSLLLCGLFTYNLNLGNFLSVVSTVICVIYSFFSRLFSSS